ncbi:hypothetical protein [Heyndrickxia camelliae]|uniref:Uncharacterized protein n=1 Tax=Heyndrickxia camelliae TaxID=1707093 RepID=A0A2N3LN89_9BACI|nr:hypothetical protein [Heyndrickxia camelliae]PKR86066.1 hypothetical protein CWO92_06760 [Heyndrickxia camelliae]
MLVMLGVVLLIIGLASAIYLLSYGYKEFKKDETKKSKKVFFLIIGLSEILSPSSLSGFAFLLSLGAILIGIVLITSH